MLWKDDSELFQLCKTELFTAVVGHAMKVLEADFFQEENVQSKNPAMHKPFGLIMEALNDLKLDEVYVCTGSSPKYAL